MDGGVATKLNPKVAYLAQGEGNPETPLPSPEEALIKLVPSIKGTNIDWKKMDLKIVGICEQWEEP